MKVALALLLVLVALEGVVLAVWPSKVKAILAGSHNVMLRIIGVLELVLVGLLLWIVLR